MKRIALSCALLSVLVCTAACPQEPAASPSGFVITVRFASELLVDQLQIELHLDGEPAYALLAPDPARLLSGEGETVEVLLDDVLAGRTFEVRAHGLSEGVVQGSGLVLATLEEGLIKEVVVELGSPAICGDGALRDAFETCDDGGDEANDGCSDRCQVEAGYACAFSPSVCTRACGNGTLEPDEGCDDGDNDDGDGCSASCELESGWTCETVGAACVSICGDGLLRGTQGCDDGATAAGDGCSSSCQVEPGYACAGEPSECDNSCGDGAIDRFETCDDGNTLGGDGCGPSCAEESGFVCPTAGQPCVGVCGDGIVVAGTESCDDANATNADGCSDTCAVEAGFSCVNDPAPSTCFGCGDGDIAASEQCDDGDEDDGDGCSAGCALEPGWVCQGTPSTCAQSCGNGVLNPGEACDDGAFLGADGCSPNCTQEEGFECPSVGVACVAFCGDGLVRGDEQCDDANDDPEDGCALCVRMDFVHCEGEPSVCVAGCEVGGASIGPDARDPADPCRSCQPGVDPSAYSAVGDGASCSDGDFCNGAEICLSGTCSGGVAPCVGKRPTCNAVLSVCECAGTSCDDGAFCNGDETCGADGACVAGTAPACAAPSAICSEAYGACVACELDVDCVGVDEACIGGACVVGGACTGTQIRAYVDADEDGIGAGPLTADCHDVPLAVGLSDVTGDCDDGDPALSALTTLHPDLDRDGYTGAPVTACAGSTLPADHYDSAKPPPVPSFDARSAATDDSYGDAPWTGLSEEPVDLTLAGLRGFGASFWVGGDNGTATHYLRLTDLDLGVPAGATVIGVRVSVDRRSAYFYGGSLSAGDASVRLVVDGAVVGDDKARPDNWAQAPVSEVSYGGPTDLWGLALSAAQLNSAEFGLAFSGWGAGQINWVRFEVFTDAGVDCDDANATVWSARTAWPDNDGDHYSVGSAFVGCAGTTPPPGASQTALGVDCYDGDDRAFPGSSSALSTDRGDGSFDYDCDGLQTKVPVDDHLGCTCSGNGPCSASQVNPITPTGVCGVPVTVDRCEAGNNCNQCGLDVNTYNLRCH